MNQPLVLQVSQVNRYVKSLLDADELLQTVFVTGEISNFTNHVRTGHFYLTLKDETASIRAVMFKASNQRLRFTPENGMRVLVRGRVTLFERDGQFQLYIDDMQPDGLGALNLAFEQLRARLEKEGLFDPNTKRPIPKIPSRIGIVTSPTGAALQDMLHVLARRFPAVEVVLCPVQVQGNQAAGQIADAIRRVNAGKYADVLIVGRGGGSLEELWAFNEEVTVRAVKNSVIPVISAVGHETDVTLCDFAADLRAPTPSAAAELAVPDWRQEHERVQALLLQGRMAASQIVAAKQTQFAGLCSSLQSRHPAALLQTNRQILDTALQRLDFSMQQHLQNEKARLAQLGSTLQAMNPLRILQRGYAALYKEQALVTCVQQVQAGDTITAQLQDGAALCEVRQVTQSTKTKK